MLYCFSNVLFGFISPQKVLEEGTEPRLETKTIHQDDSELKQNGRAVQSSWLGGG